MVLRIRIRIFILTLLFTVTSVAVAKTPNTMSQLTKLSILAKAERKHYVEGFATAYREWCKEKQNVCVAELLIRPNGMSVPDPYALIRLDMVSNMNKKFETSRYEHEKPFQVFPKKLISFSSSMRIEVSPFVWNRVEFRSSAAPTNIAPLTEWANKWMDVTERKAVEKEQFAEVVHSVIYPSMRGRTWQFMVDFGTAKPEALSALLQTLERMGLREVQVGSFSEIQ